MPDVAEASSDMPPGLAEFLTEAARRPLGQEIQVSIRELVGKWGQRRRGRHVSQRIRHDLTAAGLVTEPSFESGWIDNTVRLMPTGRQARSEAPTDNAADASEPEDQRVAGLTIGALQSATGGVTSVERNDDLSVAVARMLRHDYSQLAVVNGRTLKGAVTWESIAQAGMGNSTPTLRDATISAQSVGVEDDLLTRIPTIADAGYVFVLDRAQVPCGIVSTADLSMEFLTIARPFLSLQEIEQRIRIVIDRHFNAYDFAGLKGDDSSEAPQTADELSFGQYQRLLENPEHWARLEWNQIDRVEFIKALDQVREIRNEVMHFSPDPLSDRDLEALANFNKWLVLMGCD